MVLSQELRLLLKHSNKGNKKDKNETLLSLRDEPHPPPHTNVEHKWKQWNSVIIQRLLESWILIYGDHF